MRFISLSFIYDNGDNIPRYGVVCAGVRNHSPPSESFFFCSLSVWAEPMHRNIDEMDIHTIACDVPWSESQSMSAVTKPMRAAM